jgi:hypothetical protein
MWTVSALAVRRKRRMCDSDSIFNAVLISSVATGLLTNLVWTVVLLVDHKRKIRETGKKIGK